MKSYLLDTCVISEFVKPKPDVKVIEWFRTAEGANLYLSSITIGEIQKGITKLGRTVKAARLQEWLDNDVNDWFAERILSFDSACARTWGEITAVCEKNGKPRATLDSQIAAVASTHGLTLVTRNVSDMEGLQVDILNPWC